MSVATRGETTSWVGWLASPFRAAWRRPKTTATLALVLGVLVPWAWWTTQLWRLPDIGDPFDAATFMEAKIPDDRNAFVEYRQAATLLEAAMKPRPSRPLKDDWEWSKADVAWRDLMVVARPALDVWRKGTERPDALNTYAGKLGFETLLPVTDKLALLARLAVLEGSRLEDEGKMAEAWGWYRATLRSSRHTGRRGFAIERMIGGAMHDGAARALTRWAADPRTDAPLLRRALDEVIAIDAMTPPTSDMIKMGYLAFVNELNAPKTIIEESLRQGIFPQDPDWCRDLAVPYPYRLAIQRTRVGLRHDSERSLRVTRLLVANWLAQVDRPPGLRARAARENPTIFEADPTAPPEARALSPGALASWYESTLLAKSFGPLLAPTSSWLGQERIRQAKLVVHLAGELYRREHGQPPPSPQALVGPYLRALPEGFDAPDRPEAGK